MTALPRLGEMLTRGDTLLTYKLSGVVEGDHCVLSLTLKGDCHLRCQRCMGDFIYSINVTSRLRLVTAAELDALDGDDSIDGIEAKPQFDVLELIEDEVLLGLPFAPKHPEGTCRALIENLQQSANPFAILAGLKMK
ncbi:MAG: YceD family protein [Gallionellaceae bacterium]|nr:YceD family protein [Gallionellaceae bacterium]